MTQNKKSAGVFLLHGYLESAEIWADFAVLLNADELVTAYDIPDHGDRPALIAENMMDAWVEQLKSDILSDGNSKAILVGHSMGGYLAVSFAAKYPELLAGLCLFHSTPYADSYEKRAIRNASIAQIEAGEKDAVCQIHAPLIYAPENETKFQNKINAAITSAQTMSAEAHIASIKAMLARVDNSEIVKNLSVPYLQIQGKKDRLISNDIARNIALPKKGIYAELENSGHAGFVEEPEKAAQILNGFIARCQ